jgi:hypothetical protein
VHLEAQRKGVERSLVLAALAPYASVRQKVLLTDNEPGQRAFYVLAASCGRRLRQGLA